MKFYKMENAKQTAAHYTPAISYNGIVYISGQVPSNPITGEIYGKDLTTQLKGVLNNLKLLLNDSGSSIKDVLKVNIYLSDSSNWGIVNEIYSEFFGEHKPARIIVPSGEFHKGYLVELDAIARVSK